MQATKVVLESLGMALGHISWCLQREIQAGLSKWAIVRQELSGAPRVCQRLSVWLLLLDGTLES